MWVFAYGSLIFRPGFEFLQRVPARVHGYGRKFWQGSPDHRGTQEVPGRVVTLTEGVGLTCRGVAFEVSEALTDTVLSYLDERESGGYERCRLPTELENDETVEAWTWIARPGNANFLGDAPLNEMVNQILRASGQSGANRDYVVKLADGLAGLNIVDEHVQQLAERIREAVT